MDFLRALSASVVITFVLVIEPLAKVLALSAQNKMNGTLAQITREVPQQGDLGSSFLRFWTDLPPVNQLVL